MAVERTGPYIWTTWLSRLLVGENSCEWASWFRAHYIAYDKAPDDFDQATWSMDHTALLNDTRDKLEADGLTVYTENQNRFSLRGRSGAVLGGKPDLVSVDPSGDADGRATVYDLKTGRRRLSDEAQLLIYMYAMPRTGQYRGVAFDGRLIYGDGREAEIPADRMNDVFMRRLYALIGRVAADSPARKVPSAQECGMCEITSVDCPERIDAEDDAPEDGGGH